MRVSRHYPAAFSPAVLDREVPSMPFPRSTNLCCGLLLSLLALAGCAAPGSAPVQSAEAYDPYENTNRDIFAFNQSVDRNVLLPVAEAYRNTLPQPVRNSVRNFLQNVDEPLIFAHDVLQAEPALAANTAGRFVVNSTIGVAGFFDVATGMGIPYHPNDFGVTLARWGFPEGAYLVIPVLGPSNLRDAIGKAGDSFGDPGNIVASNYNKIYASIARAGTEGIDERSRNIETLADIERTSLDYYATIRSLYRQRRAAQIRHEQDNLPNPAPIQGSDSPAPMSYTFTR
jgi:phospholipid-binding lipoprotein MlaA